MSSSALIWPIADVFDTLTSTPTPTASAIAKPDASVSSTGARASATGEGERGREQLATTVRSATAGDPEAVEALVRRFLRPAYSVALAIVRRPADAEDVAQEAMVSALAHLESCREPRRFAAWLMQIVRHAAVSWLRERRREDVWRDPDVPDDPPPTGGGIWHADPLGPDAALHRELLLRALATLPEREREVVLLHELGGFTHAEIGEALETSEGMCRQHLFTARRRLRAFFGGREDQP